MRNPQRDWIVAVGMGVSAASAAVSSFAGLDALARLSGWSPLMAPMLPLTVDALALTATRVWLTDASESGGIRRFARAAALGAILLSLAGNATYHATAAGLIPASSNWLVVVVVGAVPALALALVSHLAVLRRQPAEVQAEAVVLPAVLSTTLVPASRTPGRTDDELLSWLVRRTRRTKQPTVDGGSPETSCGRCSGLVGRRRASFYDEFERAAAKYQPKKSNDLPSFNPLAAGCAQRTEVWPRRRMTLRRWHVRSRQATQLYLVLLDAPRLELTDLLCYQARLVCRHAHQQVG